MDLKNKDSLHANIAGVAVVLTAGIWIEFSPGMRTWLKPIIYGGAFIIFALSEPLWMWGKRMLGK